MQIHEITRKPRINEGLLGAVADVAGQSIMKKYGGEEGQRYGQQATPGTAQQSAMQLNAPLIAKLAQSMLQTYKKVEIPALMKKSKDVTTGMPVNSTAGLELAKLEEPLRRAITQFLKNDYAQLVTLVNQKDPQIKGEAQNLVKEVNVLINRIAKIEQAGDPKLSANQAALFKTLAQVATEMQSLLKFQGNKVNQTNPKYKPIMDKIAAHLPLTPQEQQILNTGIQNREINLQSA